MLADVPDPRDPRGIRYRLASLLAVAVCAVMAGAVTFAAIADWLDDLPETNLPALGLVSEAVAVRREHGGPIRIGYARCLMHAQELAGQLDLLERAGCRRVFSEKISTRVRVRPQLENTLALARESKHAAPDRAVILTVAELKRLAPHRRRTDYPGGHRAGRGDPAGAAHRPVDRPLRPDREGAMLFTVLAVAAQLDRDEIREKTLEGQQAAAARGHHSQRYIDRYTNPPEDIAAGYTEAL